MSRWRPDAQGRLIGAAIELFGEQGYEATTVAEIAQRAGLTKRTFFRYFSDKREVLFSGSHELQRLWLEGVAAAPADATPLAVVAAGLDPVAKMFTERHDFARIRAGIIESREGANGGVRLALAPEKITIRDIFAAIEQERPLFQTNIRLNVSGACVELHDTVHVIGHKDAAVGADLQAVGPAVIFDHQRPRAIRRDAKNAPERNVDDIKIAIGVE